MLDRPLLHQGIEWIGQYAQKAPCAGGGKHVGNLTARILYHLAGGESQYPRLLSREEQLRPTGQENGEQVLGLDVGVVPTGTHGIPLDPRPQVGDETRRHAVEAHGVRLIPR